MFARAFDIFYEKIHAPVLHDASQIARIIFFWRRRAFLPIDDWLLFWSFFSSAGRVRVYTCCECYSKRGYIRTWYVCKIFFFIFRLMRYTDVCFFSLSGVLFPRELTTQLNKTVKHDYIRESDRHDRRYMYIPSFALPMYKTTGHTKP